MDSLGNSGYQKLNSVVTSIIVTLSYILFLLEQINMALGMWYVAIDLES